MVVSALEAPDVLRPEKANHENSEGTHLRLAEGIDGLLHSYSLEFCSIVMLVGISGV